MLIKSIKPFLQDNSYNINLSTNQIYINNYKSLSTITDTNISLIFDTFTLNINGTNFKIIKMLDNEILFNGLIESINYQYKQ